MLYKDAGLGGLVAIIITVVWGVKSVERLLMSYNYHLKRQRKMRNSKKRGNKLYVLYVYV